MGKQGPCCHCGVTSTPLWRNGPADKPVLCNACGSRFRTKGSLANYTPMHRQSDINVEEPSTSKLRPPTSKPKAQKTRGMGDHIKRGNGQFSGQNFRRMVDADTGNWSSSGSGVSYSESRAPYGAADASGMTGSAQSHAWEPLVPSKKRSRINRPKASPIEKLAKDLNSIMHEEQSYYLSGSSKEDLLYHSETPVGSVEIGSGSVLLRNPYSKSLEGESEISSVPAENKSYVTSESYSGSASFVVRSGNKEANNLNVAIERPKRSRLQIEDSVRRETLHYENPHILESADSPLVSVDLKDVINYTNFMKYLSKEDQHQLLKLLPPIDSSTPPESSLESMFNSIQFTDAIHSYQKLLEEGTLDPSLSINEEWNAVKRLALTDLTKCNWIECYTLRKEKVIKETGEGEDISLLQCIAKPAMKPLKRPRDTNFQSYAELNVTMRSTKRVLKHALASQCRTSSLPKSGYATKDLACTGGALNLFMLHHEKISSLIPPHYTDNYSDQDLLLDLPVNARQPEAELLYQPSQQSSVGRIPTSMGRAAEVEGLKRS